MSRVVRGAWSRRGTLGALVAMTVVVTAGTVAVAGFARAAGTSAWAVAPLLLLGAVAVPVIGRELAAERREEVGLARLRGIRGPRLLAVLLTEPLLAVVTGTLLGLPAGAGAAWLSTRAWLEEPTAPFDAPFDATAVLVAVATAAGALLVVMTGYVAALREPLARQVGSTTRPRRGTTLALVGAGLVWVAAGVAVYRSAVVASGPAGSADVLVLLGPALVGLAVGQVAVWLLRGLARLAAPRADHGIAGWLAVRRVARAGDLTGPVRVTVAAAVVAVLAGTGALAVAGWSDDAARVRLAGERVVPLEEMGGVQALALSRRLDPEGEALMATVLVPGNDQLSERRGYADTSRWAAVAGGALDSTAAEPATDQVAALAPSVPVWATAADEVVVEARGLAGTDPGDYLVSVDYVADEDYLATAEAVLELAPGRGDRAIVPLDDCRVGCQVRSMSVTPVRVDGPGPAAGWEELQVPDVREVLLRTVRFGEVDVLSRAWLPGPSVQGRRWLPFRPERVDPDDRLVTNGPDGLEVLLVPAAVTQLRLEAPPELPVLATRAGRPTADFGTVAGDDRGARVVGTHAALPLVGKVGTFSDLVDGVWGAAPTVSTGSAAVVVAADAPADVVAALVDAAGAEPRTLAGERDAVTTAARAERTPGYALMAAACAGVALVALVAGAARHRRAHLREVAALRSVGVGVPTARTAGRVELAAVAGLVALTTAVGGWLAVRLLLPGLALIDVPPGALPFLPDPRVLPLVVAGVGSAGAVWVLGGRARRFTPAATRPAILREEAR